MLELDIWETKLQHGCPVVYYPQGQTGVPIQLNVKESAIGSGSVRLFAHRSDGGEVYQDIPSADIERTGAVGTQTVTIRPTDAMTCTPGNVTCQLETVGSGTTSALTFPFTIAIAVSPIVEGGMYKSSEYQVLKEALDNLEEIAGSAAEDIPNVRKVTDEAKAATTNANDAADAASTATQNANAAADAANAAKDDIKEYGSRLKRDVEDGVYNGATFIPDVDVNGYISWTNDKNLPNPSAQNIKGPRGDGFSLKGTCKSESDLQKYEGSVKVGDTYFVTETDECYLWTGTEWENIGNIKGPRGDTGLRGPEGPKGDTGAVFIPSVSPEGLLSWDNDGELPNPPSRNVVGPKGDRGEKGDTGEPAGFGVFTVSLDTAVGTPSVDYSWDGPDEAKNLTINFHGLKGEPGDDLKVLGVYDDLEGLKADHSSGDSLGDAYMVGTHYYTWDGKEWQDCGELQGATGPAGPQGPVGPQGPPGSGADYATNEEIEAAEAGIEWGNRLA